mmetsp:Transcript_132798/g.424892  ORF Transcript_132798/g.424892 Transcript_132798/m.424892 type:complete len:254 (-) Transcript_132798:496-1257(-)
MPTFIVAWYHRLGTNMTSPGRCKHCFNSDKLPVAVGNRKAPSGVNHDQVVCPCPAFGTSSGSLPGGSASQYFRPCTSQRKAASWSWKGSPAREAPIDRMGRPVISANWSGHHLPGSPCQPAVPAIKLFIRWTEPSKAKGSSRPSCPPPFRHLDGSSALHVSSPSPEAPDAFEALAGAWAAVARSMAATASAKVPGQPWRCPSSALGPKKATPSCEAVAMGSEPNLCTNFRRLHSRTHCSPQPPIAPVMIKGSL